ncbi:MAG: hypothetical protein KDM81_15525, partial [Verrucomicrobiae bacterium]|nr:hypothetical protein [Verrucomicrobiae bacterium]
TVPTSRPERIVALAAVRDCLATLRLLLGAGAWVNAPTHPGQARERSRSTAHITGHTALHLATWYRRTNSMRLLLEAGADPNAKGSTGLTPLGTIGASQRYANLGSDVHAGEPLRRTLSTGGVLLPHAGDSYIEQRSRTPAAFEILREAGGHEPD